MSKVYQRKIIIIYLRSKMAADVDTAAWRLIKQRIKPEIYTTIDGKTIVEDELLSFLAVKLKTASG